MRFAALLSRVFGVALLLALPRVQAQAAPEFSSVTGGAAELSGADEDFLDELQQRAVLFFIEQSSPLTGMTRDRAALAGGASQAPASIAATGFGLTAWCIADARGWTEPGEALAHARKVLRFVADTHQHERGWLYHFTNAETGERRWNSEASTIDTALFLQGAVLAREYLRDDEVTALVDFIYRRVDWNWALNGGRTLSHGWKPESGYIPHRWEHYSELMGLYLLGIGAPEQPLPAHTWEAWSRGPLVNFAGRQFIQCGPLFTHQFAHGWFDFRDKRDAHANYFENSIDATLAQRAWAARQASRFPSWSEEMWGLTASDGPRGYMSWGTPGPWRDEADGTVVPCAPAGSLPFAPDECLAVLRRMRTFELDGVWGRYGFADAFNPETGWVSPDVIGIDVGITLVMAENLRSGFVWKHFMRAPEVTRGMTLAGFQDDAPSNPSRVTRAE